MYYPLMLNLKGKNIVIVGGGQVAYQKLKGLENTGSNIKIVSPTISINIKEWLTHHRAEWICKRYEATDIVDAYMIFATTNNRDVNEEIRRNKRPNQLLLIADNPEESDFISPAVLRRGKLSIAISTNGASPTLAKKIKKDLEEQFQESYADYVQFLEDG
ncbi:MAG: siroheme synthase, partial [Lysinibacillus sp.]|nr:siroheme synthase [Lysinibacillus sp.]